MKAHRRTTLSNTAGHRSARGTNTADALAQIRSTWCQLQLSKAMLTAAEHLGCCQGSQRPEALPAGHGGVDAQLAVGAADRVVVDNSAAVHEHATLKPGFGVDHSTGQHHATGSQLS